MRKLVLSFMLAISTGWTICYSQLGPPGGGGAPASLIMFGLKKRDYKGNLTASDSYTWYHQQASPHGVVENGGTTYNNLEFDGSEGATQLNARGVVYTATSTSFEVDLIVRNERWDTVEGNFTLLGAKLIVPTNDPPDDTVILTVSSPTPNSFVLVPGAEKAFTCTISGVPSGISLGQLCLQYDLPVRPVGSSSWANNGTASAFEYVEPYYSVLKPPLGLQSVPFCDFLNYSCRWAFSATTEHDARDLMTRGLHYSNRSPGHRVRYRYDHPNFYVPEENKFLLKTFICFLDASLWVDLDCSDFGNLLALALNSQGVEGYATRHDLYIYNPPNNPIQSFSTTPLCRAGDDSTVYPGNYHSYGFNFHVVTTDEQLLSETLNPTSGKRFDASSSYLIDPAGSLYINPPINWTMPSFWKTSFGGLVLTPSGDAFCGDCTASSIGTASENF